MPPEDFSDFVRVRKKACEFLAAFDHVFNQDWSHSKECLRNPDAFIDPSEGTFIYPNVNDPSANWSARDVLLERYFELRKALLQNGCDPEDIDFPDDSLN